MNLEIRQGEVVSECPHCSETHSVKYPHRSEIHSITKRSATQEPNDDRLRF